MTDQYSIVTLADDDRQRLQRAYADLMALADCPIPSVRAAARAAVAHVFQALNGQGLTYELYSDRWHQ